MKTQAELEAMSTTELENFITTQSQWNDNWWDSKSDSQDSDNNHNDDSNQDNQNNQSGSSGEDWDDDNDHNDDSNQDNSQQKSQKNTPKAIQKLLNQRAEARATADALQAKIDEQNQLIAKLKNKEDPDLSDDDRLDSLLEAKLERKLLDLESKQEIKRVSEARTLEVDNLITLNPEIGKYKSDFLEACENYPELKPKQVLAILKDEKWLFTSNSKPDNYSIWDSWSSFSPTKDPANMSISELEAQLSNIKGLG